MNAMTRAIASAQDPRLFGGAGWMRKHRLFLAVVALPTVISLLYFGIFASDVYVSEASFIVRSPQRQSSSGIGALLQTTGISAFAKAADDAYAVNDFMLSRDALRQIDDRLGLRAALRKTDIDILSRFDPFGMDGSFEAFYRYYEKVVSIEFDSVSSISTVTTKGFTAKDTQAIAEQLLEAAEKRVNELNERGRADLIRSAQNEVDDAESKAKLATLNLAAYRNRHAVLDPVNQATLQMGQIGKLQEALIAEKTQLSQLRAFAPQNPQIPTTEARIRSLQSDIDAITSGLTGNGASLASKSVEYERLALERDYADKHLVAAMATLAQAREEAQRKQLYLERVVQPNLPDSAIEPKRLRAVLTTLVFSMIFWALLSLLIAGVREHTD
ncbi:hypothetical protein [Cupriavidus metallidurans]|uniref:hypothetical protein n=1 Tax=Cupriavidus metallidurans TaxID=119219 RepID=UPI001CD03045|nr:hypothetical protein [Cupriavidus metallidurans]UBM09142.1 hypothetical protein LAI70_04420 [Cupriavidus metallidurans]